MNGGGVAAGICSMYGAGRVAWDTPDWNCCPKNLCTCATSKYVCAPVSTPATSVADASVSTAQEQVPPFSWNSCFWRQVGFSVKWEASVTGAGFQGWLICFKLYPWDKAPQVRSLSRALSTSVTAHSAGTGSAFRGRGTPKVNRYSISLVEPRKR